MSYRPISKIKLVKIYLSFMSNMCCT